LPTPEEDRRIPSLQEVLDTVNHYRYAKSMTLIGIGIDFTHVANRLDRFKDHVLYPFLEKVSLGSQLNKVSAPKPLLNQLAQEISLRKGRTPIQIISQGVHGRRHLGMLLKLIEGSSVSFSIAVQASMSLFPADGTDMKAAMAATRCNPTIRNFYQRLLVAGKAPEGGPGSLHAQALVHSQFDAQT
jgi:hypothetical protein